VSGSNQTNQKGIYGNMGVPSQSNTPGGRSGSISWVDTEGLFWIFGGGGYDKGKKNVKFDLILSIKLVRYYF
jgi:hypothetical protein